MKFSRDRGTGSICVVIGVLVAYMSSQLPKSIMSGDIGPSVFPYITAAILIICGLVLIVRKNDQEPKPFLQGKQVTRFFCVWGVIIGYVVAMWLLGFVVPTLAMLTIMCMMFGRESNVPIWQCLLYAVIVTGIIYVGFSVLLNLRLPVGILF